MSHYHQRAFVICRRAVQFYRRAILFLHNAIKVLAKTFLFGIVRESVLSRTLYVSSNLTSYSYFRDLFSR
jgi:hypothetical protein